MSIPFLLRWATVLLGSLSMGLTLAGMFLAVARLQMASWRLLVLGVGLIGQTIWCCIWVGERIVMNEPWMAIGTPYLLFSFLCANVGGGALAWAEYCRLTHDKLSLEEAARLVVQANAIHADHERRIKALEGQ